MYAQRLMSRAGRLIDGLPGIRALNRALYHRRFARNSDDNLFEGCYRSFEDAAAHAPATRPLGYDNPASVGLYSEHLRPRDYPALFWIEMALLAGARRVFDLGGHTGVKYYAFREVLQLPPELQWIVCEVPAVVEEGRRLAAQRGDQTQLRFCTDCARLATADVLFASGSVQYLEESPGSLLKRHGARPRWVVLNTCAIHPERSYITLNSIGSAFCPYRVQSRGSLLREMRKLGYRCRDEWADDAKGLDLPFAPELRLDAYLGFCYELGAPH
jgi:putative methyltransferase (TIGR04325 family)